MKTDFNKAVLNQMNETPIIRGKRTVITLRPTDPRDCYAHNEKRVILADENEREFVGWPDPTDSRNSDNWNPDTDQPLTFPKFAWLEWKH